MINPWRRARWRAHLRVLVHVFERRSALWRAAARARPRFGAAILIAAAAQIAAGAAQAADDRPVAMVETIENAPDAAVFEFDYLYEGDRINLRPDGQMTVAYFDNCVVETFRGGVVRMRSGGARVTRGGSSTTTIRPCQTAALALDSQASEAGVAVKRVDKLGSLLPEEAISELTIAAPRPIFVWPRDRVEDGPATVRLYYLDATPKTLIWEAEVEGARIAYPEDAPALARGMPYEVVASFASGPDLTAVFSIDPELDLPESPLANVIPLGL